MADGLPHRHLHEGFYSSIPGNRKSAFINYLANGSQNISSILECEFTSLEEFVFLLNDGAMSEENRGKIAIRIKNEVETICQKKRETIPNKFIRKDMREIYNLLDCRNLQVQESVNVSNNQNEQ